jgi:hypothetical protein
MTRFIALIAVATVALASPALARTVHHHRAAGASARNAYARYDVPSVRLRRGYSSNPSYDVYDTSGHYVGSDPDPFIRNTLRYDEGRHSLE